MAADDLIDVRVLKHMYIRKEIRRKLVKCSINCNQKGQIVRTFRGGLMKIHSSGQTV
jgi:hypothetical protein